MLTCSRLSTGLPPFYDENVNLMYQRILHDPLRFPDEMGPEARSIMTGLLQRDPTKRLGSSGAEEIKRHPFFSKHINWPKYVLSSSLCLPRADHAIDRSLLAKKIQPPFKPSVDSVLDVANIDTEFTSEQAIDSVVESSHLSSEVQDQFKGFTYNPNNEHLSESVGYN